MSYLPLFVNYYDYDFRNASAIRLFEDIIWESAYSSYNHQEYLNIYNKYRETYDPRSLKWAYNNKLLLNVDRDYNLTSKFGTNAKSKDLKNIGHFYANSIQLDDYFLPIHLVTKRGLSEPSLTVDSLAMDDSYMDYKNLGNLYVGKSSLPIGVHNTFNYPQSHYAVLNSFRADYEDFSHFQDTSLDLSNVNLLNSELNLDTLRDNKGVVTSFNEVTSKDSGSTLNGPTLSTIEANPTQLN